MDNDHDEDDLRPVHTERTLRAFAEACYGNACSLFGSATLLDQRAPAHHALVFASIGLEEFGKAIVATVAAIRTETGDTGDRLPRKVADHRTKRLFATRARETRLGLEEFIAELAQKPLAVLLRTAREEARTYYATGGRGLSAPEWRAAALYVDFAPDGSITDPRKVTLLAAVEVGILEAVLRKYHALSAILSDDNDWSRFAKSVRRRSTGPR